MSLKAVKNSYTKMLKVFESKGIKLSDEDKQVFEGFIDNYEKALKESEKKGFVKGIIHAENKIKPVVESIFKHQTINQQLASKIQTKVSAINESKKIAKKVSNYIEEALDEIAPKIKQLDYAKLNRYETVVESLKNVLAVETAEDEFKKAYEEQLKNYFTENAKLKRELKKATVLVENTKKEAAVAKGKALLESKAAALPEQEAKKVKDKLNGLTEAEIEKLFNEACDEAVSEVEDNASLDTNTLEEDVDSIIGGGAPSPETNTEDDETNESKDTDDTEDGIQLNESVGVYSDQMARWMDLYKGI